MDRAWLAGCVPGLLIYMPSTQPVPRPVIVPEIVARMTAPPTHTTPSLAELGQHRFTALDGLGLGRPDQLAGRLARLTDSDMADLRYFLIDTAKTTVDILAVQQRTRPGPVMIWAGDADPAAMVGGTLLWADHYLVSDRACETVIASSRPQDLEDDLRELLRLRPLVETGLVVPVLEQAAALLADDAARRQTAGDLQRPDLMEWVDSQLVMEGPTARECLLFTAVDDDEEIAAFFIWAPILSVDADRHVTGRLLGPYRAGEDYGPWIAQSRQETVKNLIHNVSKHVTIADAFGADWVTTSPFKQRLLQRRGSGPPAAQALIQANVPQLSAASAVALGARWAAMAIQLPQQPRPHRPDALPRHLRVPGQVLNRRGHGHHLPGGSAATDSTGPPLIRGFGGRVPGGAPVLTWNCASRGTHCDLVWGRAETILRPPSSRVSRTCVGIQGSPGCGAGLSRWVCGHQPVGMRKAFG